MVDKHYKLLNKTVFKLMTIFFKPPCYEFSTYLEIKILIDFEVRERLASVIKEARGARSQRQFAKDLGISFATIRCWELCESFPNAENLELIAKTLGRSLEEFLRYLRNAPGKEPRVTRAEDLLPLVNELPGREAARLAQMILERWVK